MSAHMYERATASKALAMTSAVCTFAALYLDANGSAGTALTDAGLGSSSTRRLSSIRSLVTSQFVFRKLVPEMLFGLGLLYVFRHLERELGTRKFVMFSFVSTTLSVTLQLAILTVFGGLDEGRTLTPGPYGPMFSLMVLYFAYVPAVATPVGGVRINHKLPVYLTGLLLATQEGKLSLIPAACGIVAGVVAMFQLKKLVMPEAIARFGSKYLEPLFRSDPAGAAQARGFPRAGAAPRGRVGGGFVAADFGAEQDDDVLMPNFFGGPAASAAVNAVPEPSEEDIATLVGMGFDAAAATTALRRNRNDVNRAADSLLSASST